MKWLRIVFVATSIILSLVIVCAIINCEISYKYEIENRCGGNALTSLFILKTRLNLLVTEYDVFEFI